MKCRYFCRLPLDISPVYLTRGISLLMFPAFLFAMYEKDGLPLEKVLKNVITVKFIRPPVRKYEVENLYEKKKILTKAKGGTVRGKSKKR